jgi:hypothetical protein
MSYLRCMYCSGNKSRTLSGYLTGGTISDRMISPPMTAAQTMNRNRFKPFAASPFPHPRLARGIMRTRAMGHYFSNDPRFPVRVHPFGAAPAAPTNYALIGGAIGALGILVGSAPIMAAGTLLSGFTLSQDTQTIPQEAAAVNVLPGMTTSVPLRY